MPIDPEFIKYTYTYAFSCVSIEEAQHILASYPPPPGLDAETLLLISFILGEAVALICANRADTISEDTL